MVKGIEIMGWICEASHQDDIKTVRFHPPGLVGPLGAAIASSHMIGLDVEKLRCAVGIVASRAGSILANVGTMSKSTNCGHAVSEGVDAALLAEADSPPIRTSSNIRGAMSPAISTNASNWKSF